MSDTNAFLDDDNDEDPAEQSGSALRKFGKDQKKRADELERQLNELRTALAKREAGDVFAELGINEKVRKFYNGEPTKDAITEWWKENADVFGVDPASGDPTLTPEQQQTADDLSQLQDVNQLGQEKAEALGREALGQVRKDLLSSGRTEDELNAALRKMGVPDLPFMAPQF